MKNPTMRITLVISQLGPGGAERVMSKMANYWAERGHEISLITYSLAKQDFYKLNSDVRRIGLDLMRESPNIGWTIKNLIWRVIQLRKAIMSTRPQLVISFLDRTNVLTLIASIGLKIPVIVSERCDPLSVPIGNRIYEILRTKFYPRASAIVVQSEGVRQWAQKFISDRKLFIIPNPVEIVSETDISPSNCKAPDHNVIIGMGRLSREKGFDLLIKAFQKCASDHPEWSLVIYGDGTERAALEELRRDLELNGRVQLPGTTKKPAEALNDADLFVTPSRTEGFPNALLEAMACGLPVISFDCPSGPREIIRNGVDGLLVPPNDVDALAAAMGRLMSDKEERDRLAARAPEVCERFGMEKVMGLWEDVICRVTHQMRR